jgi:hypothetical protein
VGHGVASRTFSRLECAARRAEQRRHRSPEGGHPLLGRRPQALVAGADSVMMGGSFWPFTDASPGERVLIPAVNCVIYRG